MENKMIKTQPMKDNEGSPSAAAPSSVGGAEEPRQLMNRALQEVSYNDVINIPAAPHHVTEGAEQGPTNVIKRRKGLVEGLNHHFNAYSSINWSEGTPSHLTNDASDGDKINDESAMEADHPKPQRKSHSVETGILSAAPRTTGTPSRRNRPRSYATKRQPSGTGTTQDRDGHHRDTKAKRGAGVPVPDQQSERGMSQQYTSETVENMGRIALGNAAHNASSTIGEYDDQWLKAIDGEIRPRTANSPSYEKFNADRVKLKMGKVSFKELTKVLKSGIQSRRPEINNAPSTEEDVSPKGPADPKRPFSQMN